MQIQNIVGFFLINWRKKVHTDFDQLIKIRQL